jgi:hypothetical protein
MSSAKKGQLSVFCRIFQWIEIQDSAFADAIRDLCLERSLSPSGHSAGVTFLYPSDKAYRKEIIDKTYSKDADEADKMVRSLIIPDALTTAQSFNRGAGSLLGVKYAVESAEGSKVKLADGVELAPADDFKPRTFREGTLAVWVITKGRLPLTGEPYKAPTAPRRAPRTGGSAQAGGAWRRQLAAAVESDYVRCQLADRCRSHDPFLAKVVSLLNFLRAKYPEVCAAVFPVIDYDPVVSFYLLLEPYKTSGEYLIADDVLYGPAGWNAIEVYSNAVAEFTALFAMKVEGAAERAAVASQVDRVRADLLRNLQGSWRQLPQAVLNAYSELVSNNSIAGMGAILPEATRQLLASGKKLWQDEFRHILHAALQGVHQAAVFTPDIFNSIVALVRTNWPGNNYASETIMTNLANLRTDVSPRFEITALAKFVNSTDFLYLPAAADLVGSWGSAASAPEESVYNRNAVALANLNRVQGMVRAAGISPQAFQELQLYIQMHGALPPAVAALLAR